MAEPLALQTLALLLYPLVHIGTLEITALSAYYVYRQKMTAYAYAKGLLILVHIFFAGLVAVEFLRTTLFSTEFITFYTLAGTMFILIDVVLLSLLAITVYILPTGIGYKGILTELRKKPLHAAMLAVYGAYIAFAAVYLAVYSPFSVSTVNSITGVAVPIAQFTNTYLEILGGILVVFMIYPSALLVMASRKAKEAAVRRVLIILPICWCGIGGDLLAINGYLLTSGTDATPFGYLMASVAFGITAVAFRRASVLTGFFEPVKQKLELTATFPFTSLLGVAKEFLAGKNFLLEINPSLAFEQVVADYAVELLSNSYMVYVFTAKGSPVETSLAKIPGVRFYLLTGKVSYPKPEEQPYQILVPNNDLAVLLDVVDKTIAGNVGLNVGIVFDSLSDMIITSGFESSYKFLKQLQESISKPNVSSLFLMTLGAHEERTVSLTRSLFANQVVYEPAGLRVTRGT